MLRLHDQTVSKTIFGNLSTSAFIIGKSPHTIKINHVQLPSHERAS